MQVEMKMKMTGIFIHLRYLGRNSLQVGNQLNAWVNIGIYHSHTLQSMSLISDYSEQVI